MQDTNDLQNSNTSNVLKRKRDKMERLGITLPGETLKEMDELRNDVPRSKFIFRSLIEYIEKKKAFLVTIPVWLLLLSATTVVGVASMGGSAMAQYGHQHMECDFGYWWSNSQQACIPIINNPNSSIQQPTFTKTSINCEKNDDGSWTCAPSDSVTQ
jgi:hypothetical protein